MYPLLVKAIEILFGEKLRLPPDSIVVNPETREPIKPPTLPFDYKILIIAPTSEIASSYANSMLLEPEYWVFVDSKSDIYQFSQHKCEIHIIGDWYHDTRCKQLANWASKQLYTIV